MTEAALRVSQIAVRLCAIPALFDLILAILCEAYPSRLCHMIANGALGRALTFWTIIVSLLLPLYAGFEVWWIHRLKIKNGGLWINVTLSITCFLMLLAVGFYGLFSNVWL